MNIRSGPCEVVYLLYLLSCLPICLNCCRCYSLWHTDLINSNWILANAIKWLLKALIAVYVSGCFQPLTVHKDEQRESFPKVKTKHLHYLLNIEMEWRDRLFTQSTKVTMSPYDLFFIIFTTWCMEVYCINLKMKSGSGFLDFWLFCLGYSEKQRHFLFQVKAIRFHNWCLQSGF